MNACINTRHLKDGVYQKSVISLCYHTLLAFRFGALMQSSQDSGHVTICTNHVKLRIFNGDPLFCPYLQKMH